MSGSRMNMNRPGNDLDLDRVHDRHDYNNFDRRSRQGHWMRRMTGNPGTVSDSGS